MRLLSCAIADVIRRVGVIDERLLAGHMDLLHRSHALLRQELWVRITPRTVKLLGHRLVVGIG